MQLGVLQFFVLVASCSSTPVKDQVLSLPSANFAIKFKQYSGYLNTSDPSRQFFYWFIESQRNPATDPLIVWFNGGPGCSSLRGIFSEIGPFLVADDGGVVRETVHSWTKIANVLAIDSPTNTGFSSTDNSTQSDEQTALDNYEALLDFVENKFPNLTANDLYISGLSYAARHIPLLALRVLNDSSNFPHFRGISIGNGLLSYAMVFNARIYYLYYHGLIGDKFCNDLPDKWNG